MKLMREVRCFTSGDTAAPPILNPRAGYTDGRSGGAFWTLRVTVEGAVDKRTGYLCEIRAIDTLAREVIVPALRQGESTRAGEWSGAFAALLSAFSQAAKRSLAPARLHSLQWRVSPFLSLTVFSGEDNMVHVTQSFEFSAAHRLHSPELSEKENRSVYGKCSNPNGHGHNYVLEITVAGGDDRDNGSVVDLAHMQHVVEERVVARYDHRHLNLDCDEFKSLIPSVENIATVIWDRLHGEFQRCTLAKVKLWETSKTYAEYDGT